jgi:hypothetical protein
MPDYGVQDIADLRGCRRPPAPALVTPPRSSPRCRPLLFNSARSPLIGVVIYYNNLADPWRNAIVGLANYHAVRTAPFSPPTAA